MTPMMQSYQELKKQSPAGSLLLFRLGDFYEAFFEDAARAAKLFNVALTRRGEVQMAGIPYHAASSYIKQATAYGTTVAIADVQNTEEVMKGKPAVRTITHWFTSPNDTRLNAPTIE